MASPAPRLHGSGLPRQATSTRIALTTAAVQRAARMRFDTLDATVRTSSPPHRSKPQSAVVEFARFSELDEVPWGREDVRLGPPKQVRS